MLFWIHNPLRFSTIFKNHNLYDINSTFNLIRFRNTALKKTDKLRLETFERKTVRRIYTDHSVTHKFENGEDDIMKNSDICSKKGKPRKKD